MERWILYPSGALSEVLRSMPRVMERVRAVRKYRSSCGGNLARSLAAQPTAYHVTVVPRAEYLVIPEVSSERRDYVPIGYLKPPAIPSNQLLVVEDAPLHLFALLTSVMHMAWLRQVGGRLKSDCRYSSGLVYNTFPSPPGGSDLSQLDSAARGVIDARAAHSGASLADLYDRDLMPPDLRRAHAALDRTVDRMYRRAGFGSDSERVSHLFGVYEEYSASGKSGDESGSRGANGQS